MQLVIGCPQTQVDVELVGLALNLRYDTYEGCDFGAFCINGRNSSGVKQFAWRCCLTLSWNVYQWALYVEYVD